MLSRARTPFKYLYSIPTSLRYYPLISPQFLCRNPPSSASRTNFSSSTIKMTSKSADKLIPKDPSSVMVIRDINSTLTTLSVPFLRFGLIKIGGRATLVKLQSGNVAVFSPVALTEAVKSKVSSMGNLKYIVAPDIEHHIFVSPWAKEYPEAEIIGMEGLPEKREGDPATKGLKFHHVFTTSNKLDLKVNPEWDAEFSSEYFHAHGNKELVFLHKPTRTLIQADLIFNLPATEQYSKSGESATSGILTKIFGGLMHTRGEMLGQKRTLWFGPGSVDRKAFGESAKRVLAWDFDRMIPCHGDTIESGAKEIFRKATAWYVKDTK